MKNKRTQNTILQHFYSISLDEKYYPQSARVIAIINWLTSEIIMTC